MLVWAITVVEGLILKNLTLDPVLPLSAPRILCKLLNLSELLAF